MVRHIEVFVCLLAFTATSRAQAARTPEFKTIVNIENYAPVQKWHLQTAKRETGRVFVQMGIEIEWRESGAQAVEDTHIPAFSIVMLSPSMGAEKVRRDGVASITLATSSKNTGRAYMFYDRLSLVAQQQELDEGLMLAHAMTHELGHMIADVGHDGFGIMRKFLELKEAGFFGFTRPQTAAIRAALTSAMAMPAPMIALRAAPDMAR